MGSIIIEFCSWTLILFGSFSVIIGAIGVLRFPDVFTRMHAASITDTLGAGALIGGLILQAGLTLIAVKLFLILVFLFFLIFRGVQISFRIRKEKLFRTSV